MILEILAIVLAGLVIFLLIKNIEWRMRFENKLRDEIESREGMIRKDAVMRGARTLSGKTLEKLVPFLRNFGHDPHDIRWIGDPVDLIVFDGYSKNNRKEIDGITFVEVKSGASELSSGQKKIKEVVERRKVRWEEFRV